MGEQSEHLFLQRILGYAGSLSDTMSLHKYLFANSNPVMYSDPSGNFSLVEFELSEAIDEIIMSSLSFGMAYIGMVKDNPNMSDTEKFTGYLAALGLGALFPFGLALIHAMFSILVAGVILATLSLVLSLISRGIDYEKHPTVVALLKISAGATFAAALASLGNAFIQNAKKADELIHADANISGEGKQYDINKEIDEWFGDKSGPVEFKAPPNATPEEISQVKKYVNGCNRAAFEGQLSSIGRVSTKGRLRYEANFAAHNERLRASKAGTPYNGVAGHVPDTTWTNKPIPPKWNDQIGRVNNSLGAQSKKYPIGYKPTYFVYVGVRDA